MLNTKVNQDFDCYDDHQYLEMITMKTWWAPAKSNWGDGEVGDAEEQVGGGESRQQAVEHRPHLPGGV